MVDFHRHSIRSPAPSWLFASAPQRSRIVCASFTRRISGVNSPRSIETGLPCDPLFARDPNLERIREDARFKAFLAEMKKQSASLRTALFDAK